MLAKRVIPCLDVHAGRVTRGVQFGRAEAGELDDVGDPVSLALRYDEEGADELVFYDITATSEGRAAIVDVVARVADSCFMPITVGGGVRTLHDVHALFRAGADKISINSGAVRDPSILERASAHYGAQAIVLSIDVRPSSDGRHEVFVAGGREATGWEAVAWAEHGQRLGAGEIVVNSIVADGTKAGFDVALTRSIARAVDVPVVASGGAGNAEHVRAVLTEGEADAAIVAGILHRGETTVPDLKHHLHACGVSVRPVGSHAGDARPHHGRSA